MSRQTGFEQLVLVETERQLSSRSFSDNPILDPYPISTSGSSAHLHPGGSEQMLVAMRKNRKMTRELQSQISQSKITFASSAKCGTQGAAKKNAS
jgi:hypothetical protein